MKYINKRTGRIFEDENVDYVLKLVETKEQFELYEEKPLVQEEEKNLEGITQYVPKPRKKKTNK